MAISTFAVNEFGDLYLADGSNLQLIQGEDAVSQDVGQATKMVKGEDPFDTTKGVDYFNTAFSPTPDYDQFRYQLTRAALSVPDTIEVTSLEITRDGDNLNYLMEVSTIYGPVIASQQVGG